MRRIIYKGVLTITIFQSFVFSNLSIDSFDSILIFDFEARSKCAFLSLMYVH